MDNEQDWLEELEAYIQWRGEIGGRSGSGAQPKTLGNLNSILGRWFRYALDDDLMPAERDELALKAFLDDQADIKDSTRSDYERHVRRLWNRWSEFEETRSRRLAALVAAFRADGYSLANEGAQLQARERYEAILRRLPTMPHADRQQIKDLWRKRPHRDYGGPGNIVQLGSLIDQATHSEWETLRQQLETLCFGPGDLADRLQAATEGVSGLGWTTATRLVAICDPEHIIPNYSLNRSRTWAGKLDNLRMLLELGLLDAEAGHRAKRVLEDHPRSKLSGRAVVESNDLLLEILQPYFSDGDLVDTWGMRTFLQWLSERQASMDESVAVAAAGGEPEAPIDEIDFEQVSDELLCDVSFLEEIVALLKDKGQVILYGPPGTGKTYFARRLAWALTDIADDEEYEENGPYSLVQFHPAYSYEDFFEGFRPAVDDDGQMTYQLTPGPLVRLAERAADHPDELHVMVIDEINRANLPRVLGELLYLLEYRDEWTHTQYRPVDGFVLPSNLWIIGTMNTADRSIALIDAAMRRRFHFVPLFPNRPPTKDLLQLWTERAGEQAWVAEMLDAVNEELEAALGGDHLLIGPSHFMKDDLDKDRLRRIWQYNIEPLIEDQLFGHQDAIDSFRFDAVWKRHGPGAAAQEEPAEPSETLVDDDVGDTESGEDESGGSASE